MGTLAFHQVIGAYSVTFTYAPCVSSTDVFIMMDFGKMTAAGLQGWHTLMQCNTMMFGINSPVFGLSEAGNLIIQRVYPLASATGQQLHVIVAAWWIGRTNGTPVCGCKRMRRLPLRRYPQECWITWRSAARGLPLNWPVALLPTHHAHPRPAPASPANRH